MKDQYVTNGIPNAHGVEPPPERESPAALDGANGANRNKRLGEQLDPSYSNRPTVSQPKHIARRSRFAAQMARAASPSGSWQRSFSHRTPIGGAK